MIRAKFRCMEVTQTWEGIYSVKFRPVYQKKGDNPYCNAEENKKFWDATPSGEASLTFQGPHEYLPGAYYYIDMTPSPEGEWAFCELKKYSPASYNAGDIYMALPWAQDRHIRYGEVRMTLRYRDTLAMFGEPGDKWDIQFHLAEPSDS